MDRDTQEACRKGRLEAMRGALFGVIPAFYTAFTRVGSRSRVEGSWPEQRVPETSIPTAPCIPAKNVMISQLTVARGSHQGTRGVA